MPPIRLSSRLAGRHKWLHMWVYPSALLLSWGLYILFMSDRDLFFLIHYSVWVLLFAYVLHTRGRKLYQLSYDSENLYLAEGKQEEIIPLWQVRKASLISLNGSFRIEFAPGAAAHDHILFLPSFWYPLNFKFQDARVELFQQAVERARRRYSIEKHTNQLPS